jgi:hypothetical protein
MAFLLQFSGAAFGLNIHVHIDELCSRACLQVSGILYGVGMKCIFQYKQNHHQKRLLLQILHLLGLMGFRFIVNQPHTFASTAGGGFYHHWITNSPDYFKNFFRYLSIFSGSSGHNRNTAFVIMLPGRYFISHKPDAFR